MPAPARFLLQYEYFTDPYGRKNTAGVSQGWILCCTASRKSHSIKTSKRSSHSRYSCAAWARYNTKNSFKYFETSASFRR